MRYFLYICLNRIIAMRRFLLTILMGLAIIVPSEAQSRRAVKQAKKDTKIEIRELKSEGYKSLDNAKLDEVVNRYLTAKYSVKSSYEAIGKATDKDLNVAKAEARADAFRNYPEEDVLDSFFVFKKARGRYEVICYVALKGQSAKEASRDRVQSRRRSDGTEATIASARAEQEAREAKEKREKAQAKKARKARQDEKRARRAAQGR